MQILSTLGLTVGTAAVQVSSNSSLQAGATSVLIQADPANSDKVYVGTSNVTSSNGLILVAGASLMMDGIGLGGLYVIGGAASQGVRVLVFGN